MRKVLLLTMIFATVTFMACGNKTQRGNGEDSLQEESIDKHTEDYIRQRLDTIYKYCSGTIVNKNANYDSLFTTSRYWNLHAETERLSNVLDDIYFDYNLWIQGQDKSDDWSYKVNSIENITDTSAIANITIHNFSNKQNILLDLRFERGDWYVNDFLDASSKHPEKEGEIASMTAYIKKMSTAEKLVKNLSNMRRQFRQSEDTDENDDAFTRWTPIDIDGDGIDEVYLSLGEGQNGAFFTMQGDKPQLVLVETWKMRAYTRARKNGKGYICKGGSAGGPAYYNEVITIKNSRKVESFNMLTIGSQLDEDAEPDVEATLNGKSCTKAKAEAYMKALPEGKELKIKEEDWLTIGLEK